jgi:hypothetical protein
LTTFKFVCSPWTFASNCEAHQHPQNGRVGASTYLLSPGCLRLEILAKGILPLLELVLLVLQLRVGTSGALLFAPQRLKLLTLVYGKNVCLRTSN